MPSPLVIMEFTSPGHKTICLPFQSEAEYRKLITKGSTFRAKLDELGERKKACLVVNSLLSPELLPTFRTTEIPSSETHHCFSS